MGRKEAAVYGKHGYIAVPEVRAWPESCAFIKQYVHKTGGQKNEKQHCENPNEAG